MSEKMRAAIAARRAQQAAEEQARAEQETARQAELAQIQAPEEPVFGLEDVEDCALDDEERKHRYFEAAVIGLVTEMLQLGEGGRNCGLNERAFRLASLAAGLGFPVQQGAIALAAAAKHVGLPDDEIARTLKSALAAGAKKPAVWSPA